MTKAIDSSAATGTVTGGNRTVELQLRSRLQQLSSTQLEELAEALLDFSSIADLETWLQIH